MGISRPAYLFQRVWDHAASEEEKAELMEWISREENAEAVKKLMDNAWAEFPDTETAFENAQSQKMLHRILSGSVPEHGHGQVLQKKLKFQWLRLTGAAAILALVGASYFWLHVGKPNSKDIPQPAQTENDVAPGSSRATLTLANGRSILLDSLHNGTLAQQGNTRVVKSEDKELVYQMQKGPVTLAVPSFNILTIPRGGQYQVMLPDGSKVWLNAASSLKYPTSFTGNERSVELRGEAYFEIAPNRDKPFFVTLSTGKGDGIMKVEVLGTDFNVNAYSDEPSIQTTLLEGAVKIIRGPNHKILGVGQQATVIPDANTIDISKANVEEATAWKNDNFYFDGEDMGSIMRKIARWYDVKVTYERGVPTGHYTGIISRHTKLSQVLKMLELSGVHFNLQNREITVKS